MYPAEFAAPASRRAYAVAIFCDAEGTLTHVDVSKLPEALRNPVEEAMRASTIRPAHTYSAPTPGFRRVLLAAYFTPVAGQPTPRPRFHFDEAARNKLETIARTVVKGWLRIRITVSRDGTIRKMQTQNRHLDAVLETLVENDLQIQGPPFEPALVDGRPAEGQLDLFWDFTLPSERDDYTEAAPKLVRPGANPLDGEGWPEESLSFKAVVFPHSTNVVLGAYLDTRLPSRLRDAVLTLAESWYIPDKNTRQPLEVELQYDAGGPALVVGAFRSVAVTESSLRFSARPIYPKRRFLPDPDGFVRVAMEIGTDGWLKKINILEASVRRFREPALEALEAWHFSPMTFDEKAIPSKVFLTLPLRSDDR